MSSQVLRVRRVCVSVEVAATRAESVCSRRRTDMRVEDGGGAARLCGAMLAMKTSDLDSRKMMTRQIDQTVNNYATTNLTIGEE